MANRLVSCDANRLRSYLNDRLSAGDQAELADPLDRSGTCHRTLKGRAAGSWSALPPLGRLTDPLMPDFSPDEKPGRPREKLGLSAGRERNDDGLRKTRWLRSRIATGVAAVLLVAGLAAAGMSPRTLFGSPPPSVGLAYALGAGDGPEQGGKPAQVAITDHAGANPTIVGSGKPATKRWDLADFTEVEVSHPFHAELTRADRFAVTVTADDNVLEHVQVTKEGTRLRLRLEDNQSYRLHRDSLKVAIALPDLVSLSLSHGARASIGGFESKRPFEARVIHGGRLEGSIGAGPLVLNVMHGGKIALKGTAEVARLTALHGSQLALEGLVIRDAEIELAHGARATINSRPEKGLKARVAHSGTLAGTVQGGVVNLKAEHGAGVTLKGSAQSAAITGGHSGRFSLGELTLDAADVRLEHGSSATVDAKRKLDYRLNHSSHLKYLGNPTIGRSSAGRESSAQAIRAEDLKDAAGAAPATKPAEADGREDGSETITIHLNNNQSSRHDAIEGSGQRITKTVDIKDFTAIRIDRLIVADITRADSFGVSLTADDNILGRIETIKEGSTLRIRLAEGNYRLRERPHATITLPALDAIDLDGASKATIQGFASDRPFRTRISGASALEGSIQAGDVDFNISGASTVALRGAARSARLVANGASKLDLAGLSLKAENVKVDVEGASSVHLGGSAQSAVLKAEGASRLALADLVLETADVTLTGASNATVQAKRSLNYELHAASRLEYSGQPTIGKAERHSASSVSHR